MQMSAGRGYNVGAIRGNCEKPFNGVKVFTATMMADRERLGERVTHWLDDHPNLEICDCVVTQSSDESFHCLAITLFYYEDLER